MFRRVSTSGSKRKDDRTRHDAFRRGLVAAGRPMSSHIAAPVVQLSSLRSSARAWRGPFQCVVDDGQAYHAWPLAPSPPVPAQGSAIGTAIGAADWWKDLAAALHHLVPAVVGTSYPLWRHRGGCCCCSTSASSPPRAPPPPPPAAPVTPPPPPAAGHVKISLRMLSDSCDQVLLRGA